MQSIEGHLYIDLMSIPGKNINKQFKTKNYKQNKQKHFVHKFTTF